MITTQGSEGGPAEPKSSGSDPGKQDPTPISTTTGDNRGSLNGAKGKADAGNVWGNASEDASMASNTVAITGATRHKITNQCLPIRGRSTFRGTH